MDNHVAQLVDMGFDARAAVAALHDHGAQFEEALTFLMTNPDFVPGVLHPTSSTPGTALLEYKVSVPSTVAGTYLEVSVAARGQEWSLQKRMSQFEALRGEMIEAFAAELGAAAPFPQAGMFGSQEDPALVESRRVYADEFFRVCAHSEMVSGSHSLGWLEGRVRPVKFTRRARRTTRCASTSPCCGSLASLTTPTALTWLRGTRMATLSAARAVRFSHRPLLPSHRDEPGRAVYLYCSPAGHQGRGHLAVT